MLLVVSGQRPAGAWGQPGVTVETRPALRLPAEENDPCPSTLGLAEVGIEQMVDRRVMRSASWGLHTWVGERCVACGSP